MPIVNLSNLIPARLAAALGIGGEAISGRVTLSHDAVAGLAVGALQRVGENRAVELPSGAVTIDALGADAAAAVTETTSVKLGSWAGNFTDAQTMETQLGFEFDYLVVFARADTFDLARWNADIKPILDDGRQVVLNLSCDGTLESIISGAFDTKLTLVGNLIRDYGKNHPGSRPVLLKTLHEMNLSTNYAWCVYNSTNLAANGGSTAATAARFVLAYQHVSTVLRAAATDSSNKCHLKMVCEYGPANTAGAQDPLSMFYPGGDYVDILSVNAYNRYGVTSGTGTWTGFKTLVDSCFDAWKYFASDKPWMIGESSCTPDGSIHDVAVTAGGSGYSAGTTATITTNIGFGATITPTVSGGVITAVTVNTIGQSYRPHAALAVTLANTGGGSGATFTINIAASKNSKSQWFIEQAKYLKTVPQIKYLSWFLTDAFTSGDPQDSRYWAFHSAEERNAAAIARGLLKNRALRNTDVEPFFVSSPNLCPDPFTDDITNWVQAGANQGSAAFRTTSEDNLPSTADTRQQALATTLGRPVTGVLRMTHNGTASASRGDQRLLLQGPLRPAAAQPAPHDQLPRPGPVGVRSWRGQDPARPGHRRDRRHVGHHRGSAGADRPVPAVLRDRRQRQLLQRRDVGEQVVARRVRPGGGLRERRGPAHEHPVRVRPGRHGDAAAAQADQRPDHGV
jgi:hypothetical protein